METRRRDARAGLVPTAPTATRLADVVRGARFVSGKSVAYSNNNRAFGWPTKSRGAFRTEPVLGQSAALHSRDSLPLPFYDRGRTSTNRCVVEASGIGGIFAEHFARRRSSIQSALS